MRCIYVGMRRLRLPSIGAVAVVVLVGGLMAAAVLAATAGPGKAPQHHRHAPAASQLVPAVSASTPRYYVVASSSSAGVTVVIRDSADGRVTGRVAAPYLGGLLGITAAPDDRHFVVTIQNAITGGYRTISYDLLIGADGRLVRSAELTSGAGGLMAVSADGSELAVTGYYSSAHGGPPPFSAVSVINLATGARRTWISTTTEDYSPGAPAWLAGGRTIAFTWVHLPGPNAAEVVGTRLLDVTTPGTNLLSARLVRFRWPIADADVPAGSIPDDSLTPDGRYIVRASCHDFGGAQGSAGRTAIAQILEYSAADGRFLRNLRTQTFTFPTAKAEQKALQRPCSVLAVDPTGRHMLVDALQFGRLDDGRWTPLPGPEPAGAAAW